MATPERADPVAHVVVKPRGGVPQEPPSSANLRQWAPDPKDLAGAREHFEAAGFEVGPAQGGTFSIEGPPALFESTFGVRLKKGKAGTYRVAGEQDPGAALPLDNLPLEVRRLVHSAGFPEPPDFGPGSFA